jgi:Ran GTPase-activating protein (RanGAP) involved in mRNA processing and transport
MAAAAVLPVSVPTSLGGREVVDIGVPEFNLQRLENPQASIHQCATKYGSQTIRSVFDKFAENDKAPSFEEINLSDNAIGDEGAAWLKAGLSGNSALKTLLLPRTGMTAVGVKAIGTLIGESPNVETVVLSSNAVDAEGLDGEFCDGLAKNKSLKSLYLAVCRLGSQGIVPLCEGPLRSHPSLEHISLTYNRLEATAGKTLADMLRTNQALRYLDVSGNSLGPEGAMALCEGLKANEGRLQKLGFAQNAIKHKGAEVLINFFLSVTSLEYLDIRHNRVNYRDMMKLRVLLEKGMNKESDGWLYLFDDCSRQLFVNGSN